MRFNYVQLDLAGFIIEKLKTTIVNDTDYSFKIDPRESILLYSPNGLALQPRKLLSVEVLSNATYRRVGLFLFEDTSYSKSVLDLTLDDFVEAEEIRIFATPRSQILFRITKWRQSKLTMDQRSRIREFKLALFTARNDAYTRIKSVEKFSIKTEKLSRQTIVFHSQCNYLVQRLLKGIEEVKHAYSLVCEDENLMWYLYTWKQLSQLISSLDSLLRDLNSAERLLRECGGKEWKKVAVVLSMPPPELHKYSGSRFFLLIRDFNWSLDMIRYSLQFPAAPQSSTATDHTLNTEELIKVKSSGLSRDQCSEEWKFDWSDRRCGYRLQRIVHASEHKVKSHEGDVDDQTSDCKDEIRVATDGARSREDDVDEQASDCKDESTGVAGGIEESLKGDFDRQANDRKDLLDNIDRILSTHTHGSSILFWAWQLLSGTAENARNKFLALVKNRCQDISGSGSPNLVSTCFEIDHLDLRMKDTVFEASSVSIHKANWLEQEVVVKVFRRIPRDVVEKEAAFMVKLHHPNVVDFFGVAFKEEDVSKEEMNAFEKIEPLWTGYLVMELMQGDLRSLIDKLLRGPRKQESGGPFPLSVTVDILLQIVAAMIHAQKFGVLHRDLKAKNCLMNPKPGGHNEDHTFYTVKLIDFGESKWWSKDDIQTRKKGTVRWMAPEVWESSKYTGSADVYSFGMTCYEIVTGLLPFHRIPNNGVMKEVLKRERPSIPGTCPQSLSDLMKKCWAHEPEERPTFEAIQKEMWGIKFSVDVRI